MRSQCCYPCGAFNTAPSTQQGLGEATLIIVNVTGHCPQGPIWRVGQPSPCGIGAGGTTRQSGMSGVWPGRRGQRGWWTESEEDRDAKYEKGVRSSSSCFQRHVGAWVAFAW